MKLGLKLKKQDDGIRVKGLPMWYVEISLLDGSNLGDGTCLFNKEPVIITANDFIMIQAMMASIDWHEAKDSVKLRSSFSDPNIYLRMISKEFDSKEDAIPLIQTIFPILSNLCDSARRGAHLFDNNDLQVAVDKLSSAQQNRPSGPRR